MTNMEEEIPDRLNINQQSYTNRELWLIINNNMEQNKTINDMNTKEHQEIKDAIIDMSEKIDIALEKKADRSTVDGIVNFLWGLGAVIGTGLIGYVGTLLLKLINL